MKKTLIIQVLVFTFFSCNNSYTVEQEGYVNLNDTSYKENSTEIGSITRTFYQKNLKDGSIKLTKSDNDFFDDDDFGMSILTKDAIASAVFNDKSFDKFIQDCQTVLDNKDKDLRYTFGLEGSISSFIDNQVSVSVSNGMGQTAHAYLTVQDLVSMKNAYDKFNSEQ